MCVLARLVSQGQREKKPRLFFFIFDLTRRTACSGRRRRALSTVLFGLHFAMADEKKAPTAIESRVRFAEPPEHYSAGDSFNPYLQVATGETPKDNPEAFPTLSGGTQNSDGSAPSVGVAGSTSSPWAARAAGAAWGKGTSRLTALAQGVTSVVDLAAEREKQAAVRTVKALQNKSVPASLDPSAAGMAATGPVKTTAAAAAAAASRPSSQPTLVLDAGAFISGADLANRFGAAYRYVTIPDVIKEVKDERSRQAMARFPFAIESLSVRKESLSAVAEFAKLTGDLYFLSKTDLRVLALTHQLEVEAHGNKNVRARPRTTLPQVDGEVEATQTGRVMPFAQLQPRRLVFSLDKLLFGPTDQDVKMQSSSSSEAPGQGPDGEGDNGGVGEDAKDAGAASAGAAAVDNEGSDDEGEWITPENFGEKSYDLVPAAEEVVQREESTVACVTTDFTMQNLMLQMGLRLLSPDGRVVRSVRRWQLQCYSCWEDVVGDLSRQFCPKCGNATLARVSVSVENGVVRYRRSNRGISKRGKVYPIPKPKGGRGNKDLILREDVMKQRNPDWVRKVKAGKGDLFDKGSEFALGSTGPSRAYQTRTVVGYGRKNPNVAKRRTRGRRRKGKR